MPRLPYTRLLPAVLVLPALGAWLGGWAVTTVDHLPDYIEAGKPFTISYVVRQHGEEPLQSLRGELEATTLASSSVSPNGRARSRVTWRIRSRASALAALPGDRVVMLARMMPRRRFSGRRPFG